MNFPVFTNPRINLNRILNLNLNLEFVRKKKKNIRKFKNFLTYVPPPPESINPRVCRRIQESVNPKALKFTSA